MISEKAPASDSGAADVSAVPVSVGVADSRRQTALAALTVIVALALVLAPPLITHRIRIRAEPRRGPGGGHRP